MVGDTQIPIILGRPFLHTAGAIIDVKQGRLTLKVGDDMVTFNLASTLAKPMIEDTCYAVEIVDESMFDYWMGSLLGDPLEALIALDDFAEDEQVDYRTMKAALKGKEFTIEKDDSEQYPVIVNAKLDDNQLSAWLVVLKKNRKALGYSLDDLKGINPDNFYSQVNWMKLAPTSNPTFILTEKGLVFWKVHYYVQSHIQMNEYRDLVVLKILAWLGIYRRPNSLKHELYHLARFRGRASLEEKGVNAPWLLLFISLGRRRMAAPIIQPPDWELSFEIMCDPSDYAIGAVLGQRKDRALSVIYYASRTLDEAQVKYATTEKELLAVKFYWEIKDKKDAENVVADHLSRLPLQEEGDSLPINDSFPEDILLAISNAKTPWYADYANFIVGDLLPPDLSYQQRKRFLHDVKQYFGMILICLRNVLMVFTDDAKDFVVACDACQRTGNISRRHEMPQVGILEVGVFDVWGIDYQGLFPSSKGNKYILVAVDYVSKWVEVVASVHCDAKTIVQLFKKVIFPRFGVPRVIISDGGIHFKEKQLTALLSKYGVEHRRGLGYHPQTSGQFVHAFSAYRGRSKRRKHAADQFIDYSQHIFVLVTVLCSMVPDMCDFCHRFVLFFDCLIRGLYLRKFQN
ncbi:uncharacterized protein LOC141595243 [Silene latifolia]|uniref:uncharacterized protein LOC141595243 n=1 Tax=Silene latifolia TaxID=37657 RepID=UPI003D76EE85